MADLSAILTIVPRAHLERLAAAEEFSLVAIVTDDMLIDLAAGQSVLIDLPDIKAAILLISENSVQRAYGEKGSAHA